MLLWFVRYAFDLPWLAVAPSGLVLLQWIVAAYVIGSRRRALSEAIISYTVVRRWLGRDETTLFTPDRANSSVITTKRDENNGPRGTRGPRKNLFIAD